MKKLFTVFAMVLTFGLLANGAVMAQGTDAQPEGLGTEFNELDGFESAYMRSFKPEMEFNPTESIDLAAVLRGVNITAVTFDSDDNAQKALDQSIKEIEATDPAQIKELGIEWEKTDIGDGGINAIMTMDMGDGLSLNMNMMVFRDGNTFFQVISIDSDADAAKKLANDVTEYILDHEVQDETVSFNEEGGSTGGVFDRMPKTGDEIVGELVNESDMDLTAAGTPAN